LNRTITLNAIEPAQLSLRVPLGIELDLDISFRSQLGQAIDPNTLQAQLVLIPRSRGGSYAYDFQTVDSGAGLASVVVPSSTLSDPRGYGVELYQRITAPNPDDPPIPVGLLAKGVMVVQGASYSAGSPLGPIVVPQIVGPQGAKGDTGAQGPQGIQGVQGAQGIQGLKGDKGDQGIQGVQGAQGIQGIQGIQGPTGPANVLTIGTVTTGAPGTAASATISGAAPNQTISFVIPRGDVGAQGIQGIQGIQGPAGTPAINLRSGTVDPVSGDGVVGDFYVNLTSGSLFGPKAASGTIWPEVKLTTYWA
jgi:hypothetical protein